MPWIAARLLIGLSIGGDEPPFAEVVLLRHCETTYDRTTTLGAFVLVQAGGRIQDCYVRPGDRVRAAQVLARLHDRDAVVELERLQAVAESDIDVRLGEAKLAVAQAKLKRSESLQQRNLLSPAELQLAHLEVKSVVLEIELARRMRRNAELARRKMEAEVRSREIAAPHDGVVVEIVKNVGESCICNEPVMRIVADDRMKVIRHLDVSDTWRVRVGQSVRMVADVEGVDLAIEREEFSGRVVFVDPRIDPTNRTCQVVAEIENRGHLLRSGLQATLKIALTASRDEGRPAQHETALDSPKPTQGLGTPRSDAPDGVPRPPSR
ncbi:MAG: czcB 4 [Planctomycetota bacterium]|nr:czcB 4 [Planctomycetota bacterium]